MGESKVFGLGYFLRLGILGRKHLGGEMNGSVDCGKFELPITYFK